MEANQEYFVFISYSSLDNEWAIWLRHELEHYHLPASFNGRTDVRDNLRKVFRDRDELNAGPEWDEQVNRALANTNNLIVICSPNAAKSEAVNKEVEAFIALGKEDHIFPFIVEGNKPEDCFPPALKHSKLGGDVNKDGGRDSAFVKVVAGMLKVGFPSLWDRYEKEKAEEERKIREQRDKLLIMQSRFLAEKANDLVEEGDSYTARLLALEALPKNIENPDRPYVPEAEAALRNSKNRKLLTFQGHSDIVEQVVFTKDGENLISVSRDESLKIWSIKERKCIKTIKENIGVIPSVKISPNGNVLVTASYDMGITLWNAKSYYKIETLKNDSTQKDSIVTRAISFCPEGKFLATASIDNSIKLWDLDTKQCIKTLIGHHDVVLSIAFNFDGKFLVSSSLDKTVKIWNLTEDNSGKRKKLTPIINMREFDDIVTYVSFYSYKNDIITASWDGEIRIWNFNDKKEYSHVLLGKQDSSIKSACLSHDEKFLISASKDNVISVWDMKNQIMLASVEQVPRSMQFLGINNISFHPNNKYVAFASNDYNVSIWDFSFFFNIKCIPSHWGRVNAITTCKNKNLIASGADDSCIVIWDSRRLKELCWLKNGKSVHLLRFSPSGSFLASYSERNMEIKIWSTKKWKIIHSFKTSMSILSFDFSPSGKEILAACDNNSIVIWNVATEKVVKKIEGLKFLRDAKFSNDGKHIVTSNHTNFFYIINTNDWEITTIEGHSYESVDYTTFTEDNTHIYTSSSDGIVDVVNVKSKETVKSYGKLSGHSCADTYVVLTPNNKWFLSRFIHNIKLWDIVTESIFLSANINTSTDVVFVDERKFAWRDGFGNIIFWEIPSLKQLINETNKDVKSLTLTPEERKKYYLD